MTLTVEPDPATIDAEVERALAATVWELLSPAAAALTALYLVFAVGHLLPSRPPRGARVRCPAR